MPSISRTSPNCHKSAIVLGLVLATIALGGCTPMLNMDEGRELVSEGLAKELELEIASVTCPAEDRPIKAGDEFECIAMPKAGGKIFVKVTQDDDQGAITWTLTKSEGLFDMRKVEREVVQGLLNQTGTVAAVSCGKPWHIGEVGETIDCAVKAADGNTATAVITINDLQGGIGWAIE